MRPSARHSPSVLVPNNRKDAAKRLIVGFVIGIMCALLTYHLISGFFGDAGELWNLITGGTVAGFGAWSMIAVAARAVQRRFPMMSFTLWLMWKRRTRSIATAKLAG